MVMELEGKMYEEGPKYIGSFCLEKKRLRGDRLVSYIFLMRGAEGQVVVALFIHDQ